MDTTERFAKLTLTPGEVYFAYMPFSEVCMHLGVAGKSVPFKIVPGSYPMVQLLDRQPLTRESVVADSVLKPFSFPILLSEGGVHIDDTGVFYCYPMANKETERESTP